MYHKVCVGQLGTVEWGKLELKGQIGTKPLLLKYNNNFISKTPENEQFVIKK